MPMEQLTLCLMRISIILDARGRDSSGGCQYSIGGFNDEAILRRCARPRGGLCIQYLCYARPTFFEANENPKEPVGRITSIWTTLLRSIRAINTNKLADANKVPGFRSRSPVAACLEYLLMPASSIKASRPMPLSSLAGGIPRQAPLARSICILPNARPQG